MLLTGSSSHPVAHKVIAAILYVAAALATANWLEIGLWPEQPYYKTWIDHTIMRIAVGGSATFGLAFLVVFLRMRYALVLGLVAACLSLPYFGPMFVALPWSNPIWLVTHDPGEWEVAAILFWFLATLYSTVEAWKWKRSRERRI